MGDRAQVKIIDNEKEAPVYLYTHWGGSELENTVKKALRRGRDRWNDPCYLSRIIFSEMIKNDIMGTTGYGICTTEHGDVHTVITVNCEKQSIQIETKDWKMK